MKHTWGSGPGNWVVWEERKILPGLGGSKLRVQSELGQGLETLLWKKEGITGEGIGEVTWGGRRRGVPCAEVPCAMLTRGVGEDLHPAGLGHGSWGRTRHWGERLGAVWGQGQHCVAEQLTDRSHFACAGSQPFLCLAAPCLGTAPASEDRGWLCPMLGLWGWENLCML